MTNNEKAATFIGWKPNTPCPYKELPTDWFSKCLCGTAEETNLGNLPDHFEPAPDMSKPENYMKLWHTFADNDKYWILQLETNKGLHPTKRFKLWIEDIGTQLLTNCYAVDNIGEGIIKVFSHFYESING
jgi:hypothetical protein